MFSDFSCYPKYNKPRPTAYNLEIVESNSAASLSHKV